MINIRKRGKVYQYCFEAGKVNGKSVFGPLLVYQKQIHHELGIQCRFYDLRGSFATISLRNGCEIKDVAEVLGHERIETTQKYYILSLEENKKKVIKVFEDEMNKF